MLTGLKNRLISMLKLVALFLMSFSITKILEHYSIYSLLIHSQV